MVVQNTLLYKVLEQFQRVVELETVVLLTDKNTSLALGLLSHALHVLAIDVVSILFDVINYLSDLDLLTRVGGVTQVSDES